MRKSWVRMGLSLPRGRPFRSAVSVVVGVMLLVPVGVGPLASHLPAAANGACLVGAGTSDDPYEVTSAADLALVGSGTAGCALDASYLQTANITLAAPVAGASNHTPIGVSSPHFTGTYDGGGFTIDGLVVVVVGDHVGLFGRTDFGATIRNVHVTRGSITGGEYTGGLMGTAISAAVSGSSFSGTVTSSVGVVGGLIGYASGTVVSGSSFSGTVSGTVGSSVSNVGGLIGFGPGVDVIRSFSEGTVTGVANIGGLVGQFDSGDVHASFSTADVNGTGDRVGGLIGWFLGPWEGGGGGVLTNSFVRGDVTTTGTAERVGGLIGEVSDATIARVFATGKVSVSGTGTDVGGLVGRAASTSFTDSFWDTQTSEQLTSAAGVGKSGKTTGELTSRATFADTATVGLTTAWPIVAGWAPYVDGTTVWGICAGVNDGYPFLLWQFDTDPCSAPAGASSSSLAMSCDGTRAVGTEVTCTVTGGDAGIDILWRAAYNPVFAEAGVTLDTSGAGEFSFTVPAAALGQAVTVELVDWFAPVSIGVAGGPVPTSVPSGGGPVPVWSLVMLALAGGLVLRRMSAVGVRG